MRLMLGFIDRDKSIPREDIVRGSIYFYLVKTWRHWPISNGNYFKDMCSNL